jgi:hypothetical protein
MGPTIVIFGTDYYDININRTRCILMGAMDERAFEKLVRSHGCQIVRTSKEYMIVDTTTGKKVCGLAISHSAGSKRFVKPVYVKMFLRAIEQSK